MHGDQLLAHKRVAPLDSTNGTKLSENGNFRVQLYTT